MEQNFDLAPKNLDNLISYNYGLLLESVAKDEFSIFDLDFLMKIDENIVSPRNERERVLKKMQNFIDAYEKLLNRRAELLKQNQEHIDTMMKFLPYISKMQANLTDENAFEISGQLKIMEEKFDRITQKTAQIEQELKDIETKLSKLNKAYESELSFKMLEIFCSNQEIDIHEYDFDKYVSWLVKFLDEEELRNLLEVVYNQLGYTPNGIIN